MGIDPEELIGSAYDAALDLDQWPSVLEGACRLFDANMGIVRIIDAEGRDVLMLGQGACLSADLLTTYQTSWIEKDIHLQKVFNAPALWNRPVLAELEVAGPQEERQSAYVNEFLRPVDLGRIVTTIWKGKTGAATAAFHRSLSAPLLGKRALDVGQRVLPHLIRAARMTARQHAGEGLRLSAASLFGDAAHPVFLLDDRARVLWFNPIAEVSVVAGKVRVGSDGTLRLTRGGATMLFRLVEDAKSQRSAGSAPRLAVIEIDGERVVCRGRVVGRETWPRILFQRTAILLECHRVAPSRSTADRLCEVFGLTSAEASVAVALSDDAGINDIAALRGVSNETVRKQSQSIFRKIGISRRSALTQIVAKLSD